MDKEYISDWDRISNPLLEQQLGKKLVDIIANHPEEDCTIKSNGDIEYKH